MERKVEGTTPGEPETAEERGRKRGAWERLFSDEGPGFEVPLFVRWAIYVLLMLFGLALIIYAVFQLPLDESLNEPEPGLLQVAIWGLIGTVYIDGWSGGTKRLLEWLFGPDDRD